MDSFVNAARGDRKANYSIFSNKLVKGTSKALLNPDASKSAASKYILEIVITKPNEKSSGLCTEPIEGAFEILSKSDASIPLLIGAFDKNVEITKPTNKPVRLLIDPITEIYRIHPDVSRCKISNAAPKWSQIQGNCNIVVVNHMEWKR